MSNKIKRKLICIRCPRGCEIETTIDGIEEIKGNICKLGEEYVKNEINDPRRIITTTVRVKGGIYPLVPVWTTAPIPKDKIPGLIKLLRTVELDAPVEIDKVVIKNIFELGIDIVTSSTVAKKNENQIQRNNNIMNFNNKHHNK